ncbi:MAG: TerC/Alx family metal homeostasis membrane protein [Bacteroidetes bacterium]|nr:TerC/Alx family metal homeostasis membrane protein [Bacteroidota bacterium]
MSVNLNELVFFISFLVFIVMMLMIDLGVFQKHSHTLKFKESLAWTLVWVSISFAFFLLIRYHGNWIHGADSLTAIQERIDKFHHPISIQGLSLEDAISRYNRNLSLEYLTGYLIEYSLSVDNIFVIVLIFISFKIKPFYYKKVLFWGILGAVVMRFLFIFVSAVLIQRFEWFLYVFGIMLVIIGLKMGWEFFLSKKEEKIDTEHHPVVIFMSKYFRVTKEDHDEKFWINRSGKIFFTPLFLVLLIIELSDVLFAVDSVPAVFSVTLDPYIVFFSNIFAILGLRSLFFLVMDVMNRFHYLKLGLAVLLSFVGVKMLGTHFYKLSTNYSLLIIASILAFSIIASLIRSVIIEKSHEKRFR